MFITRTNVASRLRSCSVPRQDPSLVHWGRIPLWLWDLAMFTHDEYQPQNFILTCYIEGWHNLLPSVTESCAGEHLETLPSLSNPACYICNLSIESAKPNTLPHTAAATYLRKVYLTRTDTGPLLDIKCSCTPPPSWSICSVVVLWKTKCLIVVWKKRRLNKFWNKGEGGKFMK
jgi:hypothetical protein